MLFLLKSNLLLYGIIFAGLIGVVSRIRLSFICRKLEKEADNIASSGNELMMQIKKKYENSMLLNKKIPNTRAFVEKHLRRYQTGKITLRGLGSMNCEMMLCVMILGCVGGLGAFFYGQSVEKIVLYPAAAVLNVLLLLFCEIFLETESRMENVRISIVDYLENTVQNRSGILEETVCRPSPETAAVKEEKKPDLKWNTPEDEALVRQVLEEYFS